MSGAAEEHDDDLQASTWPSFVDVLASMMLVLAFAILLLVIVISLQSVTKSLNSSSDPASLSQRKIESDIVSEYKAEFQKLALIANPALRENSESSRRLPVVDDNKTIPQYNPETAIESMNPEKVVIGTDTTQVIGEVEKRIDTNSVQVLQELVIVQKDVIEQQRKVIEQLDQEIQDATVEYQSLLSIKSDDMEVEDVRQKIEPRNDMAFFRDPEIEGEQLSGPSFDSAGQSAYFLTPPNSPIKAVNVVRDTSSVDAEVVIEYRDDSSVLKQEDYDKIVKSLSDNIDRYIEGGVTIDSKSTDYSVSGSLRQRIAVERVLIVRSILLDLGVSADMIRLNPVTNRSGVDDGQDYGWVSVKVR